MLAPVVECKWAMISLAVRSQRNWDANGECYSRSITAHQPAKRKGCPMKPSLSFICRFAPRKKNTNKHVSSSASFTFHPEHGKITHSLRPKEAIGVCTALRPRACLSLRGLVGTSNATQLAAEISTGFPFQTAKILVPTRHRAHGITLGASQLASQGFNGLRKFGESLLDHKGCHPHSLRSRHVEKGHGAFMDP